MKRVLFVLCLGLATPAFAQLTCNNIGSFTHCSDGTTLNRIGDTTYMNNSQTGVTGSANRIGDQTFGSDSTGRTWNSNRIGDQTFGSDNRGTTWNANRIGDSTFINNNRGGSTNCRRIGQTMYCD